MAWSTWLILSQVNSAPERVRYALIRFKDVRFYREKFLPRVPRIFDFCGPAGSILCTSRSTSRRTMGSASNRCFFMYPSKMSKACVTDPHRGRSLPAKARSRAPLDVLRRGARFFVPVLGFVTLDFLGAGRTGFGCADFDWDAGFFTPDRLKGTLFSTGVGASFGPLKALVRLPVILNNCCFRFNIRILIIFSLQIIGSEQQLLKDSNKRFYTTVVVSCYIVFEMLPLPVRFRYL